MPEYKSKYTGAEIDALLDKVDGRTSTPAPAEDKLITSGGVYTGLAGKTDKVTSPTAGNLPKLKADGSLEDSGKKPSDFVEKEAGKGLSSNDYTDADKTKLGALPTKAGLDTELDAKEDKANKVTSFSNPTDTQYPSAKLVSDSLDKIKADVSSLLTRADIAEGLADTISAGTAQEFLQRQSGGDGVNCIKRIKGKTIAWNQLQKNEVSRTNGGVTYTYNNGTITISASGEARSNSWWLPNQDQYKWDFVAGHKLLFLNCYNSVISCYIAGIGSGGVVVYINSAAKIITVQTSAFSYLQINVPADADLSQDIKITPLIFDLTLLYGSEISGMTDAQILAKFQAEYPALSYAYNSGVLKSNDAAALLTDGRNQWDEVWELGTINTQGQPDTNTNQIRSKNFIPAFGGSTYYIKGALQIHQYRADKSYIDNRTFVVDSTITLAAECRYIKFRTGDGVTSYNPLVNPICINFSDASFNGTYQPYWQRVLALRISELTGIPEGGTEADRVTMFPNGLGGAGSAFDSIFVENGVTKARKTMARNDLGERNWTLNETYGFVASPSPNPKISFSAICEKYPFMGAYSNVVDKTCGYIFNTGILVKDSAYTDAATFKAAMSGVYLEYELATPIVYTDLQYADGTPFTMPATILVDNYGKEVIVPPTGATTPSAPFCCDSNYSISIANLVRKLNE